MLVPLALRELQEERIGVQDEAGKHQHFDWRLARLSRLIALGLLATDSSDRFQTAQYG